jgi:conserved oligomeric Golgi complex subunit 4
LDQQQKNADGLMNIIDKTYGIAQQMSSKVRKLDEEQHRVRTTLKLLDQIKDCKQCAMGVKRALRDNQLTQACDFVRRYLQTDVETIEKIYSSIPVQIVDDEAFGTSPIEELRSSQQQVIQVLMNGFDDAVEAKDTENMVRMFKLFPVVGAMDVGLDKYSAYICRQLSDNMNNVLQSKTNPMIFVECLGMLFESIASTIDKQEAMLGNVYGVTAVHQLIVRLQREADVQGCLLLGNWLDARQVERHVKVIQMSKNLDVIDVEPRDLDIILGELAVTCNKTGLFHRFMRTRATHEIERMKEFNLHSTKQNSKLIDFDKVEEFPQTTKLNEKIQGCITYFLVLGDFFIQRSIKKVFII